MQSIAKKTALVMAVVIAEDTTTTGAPATSPTCEASILAWEESKFTMRPVGSDVGLELTCDSATQVPTSVTSWVAGGDCKTVASDQSNKWAKCYDLAEAVVANCNAELSDKQKEVKAKAEKSISACDREVDCKGAVDKHQGDDKCGKSEAKWPTEKDCKNNECRPLVEDVMTKCANVLNAESLLILGVAKAQDLACRANESARDFLTGNAASTSLFVPVFAGIALLFA